YVASRTDETGALVLSEFTGAADELGDALIVNPHDIQGLKAALLRAIHLPPATQHRRMRALREAVWQNDVSHWADGFLHALAASAQHDPPGGGGTPASDLHPAYAAGHTPVHLPAEIEVSLRRLASAPQLLVVC